MASEDVVRMREAHVELVSVDFRPVPLVRGYAGRILKIDIGRNVIEMLSVDETMKKLWTGGKGFDLWLMLQEIQSTTKWDSPENPICFSSGPLGGTTSFPGSGKTLVTSISPLTESIMDCNVGGYFGPYLKFAGFDALEIIGKASEDIVIFIDAVHGKISIEKAPLESLDSHLLTEELTEMYADDEDDRRNVAVVSAGSGAQHVRLGILNFSFYDWRRGKVRLKQAGRGGIGTVFRNKKIKALVIRSREFVRPWRVAESKVAPVLDTGRLFRIAEKTDREAIRGIVRRWDSDPEYVIEMMQDVQDRERCISIAAIDEIAKRTGVSRGRLYHIATFYSLIPKGEIEIQVCVGTTCHVQGSARVMEALERELGIHRGDTTEDGKFSLEEVACLGCCSLAPVVKFGKEITGGIRSKDVASLIRHFRHRGEGHE